MREKVVKYPYIQGTWLGPFMPRILLRHYANIKEVLKTAGILIVILHSLLTNMDDIGLEPIKCHQLQRLKIHLYKTKTDSVIRKRHKMMT